MYRVSVLQQHCPYLDKRLTAKVLSFPRKGWLAPEQIVNGYKAKTDPVPVKFKLGFSNEENTVKLFSNMDTVFDGVQNHSSCCSLLQKHELNVNYFLHTFIICIHRYHIHVYILMSTFETAPIRS